MRTLTPNTFAANVRVDDVIQLADLRVKLVTDVLVCEDGTRVITGKVLSRDGVRFDTLTGFFSAETPLIRTHKAV